MSVRVMAAVWERGPQDRGELLVLLALADFSNDRGESWPSIAAIAAKARMTERGVFKVLGRLREVGLLEVDSGGGRCGTSSYRITLGNPEPGSPPQGGNPERRSPPRAKRNPERRSPPSAGNPEPGSPPGAAGNPEPRSPPGGGNPEHGSPPERRSPPEPECAKTLNPVHPEPSRDPSRDSARAEGADREVLETLSAVVPRETARAFVEHRRAKRSRITPHAALLIARKLSRCADPVGAIEESISNGWTGVFPKPSPGDRHDQAAPARRAVEGLSRRAAAFVAAGRRRDLERGQG